jgi:uncharacterized protein (TIGR00297 family)
MSSATGVPLWKPLLLASLLTARALRKKNLTRAGCVTAWFVGFFTATQGAAATTSLLVFFFSSSHITKLGKDVKKKVEGSAYHETGNRSAWQVLCNGGTATVIAASAYFGLCSSLSDRAVLLSIVAHYAACQGDTWSSELGVLSSQQPRLILGFRKVPRGTNGAVTAHGTAAAAVGGLVLGAATAACLTFYPVPGCAPAETIVLAAAAAVGGSIVDSVLGQCLQRSCVDASGCVSESEGRHISGVALLSNNSVNFLSALLVTAGTCAFALRKAS